ncbi:phosphoribosyltransferase [Haloarcula sp. CBA1115]|uniref:phosphoribosyltransferase n=1 Tax=Haloarcula sp. CBA1115 TaxID=1592728 RepID=UPI000B2D4E34|nr:phosphoribosyltransferase family protein [Haloarcula sp. CBA1115]
MFTDRSDAAQQLVAALRRRDVVGDIVVTLAPNGVPVGNVVADATGLPMDVIVIQRIRAPNHPELTIGAVAPGGFSWINSPMMRFLDVNWEYVQEAKTHASDTVESRAVNYGETWGPLDVAGKRVLLVDDGIPTGRRCVSQFSVCERQVRTRLSPLPPSHRRTCSMRCGGGPTTSSSR